MRIFGFVIVTGLVAYFVWRLAFHDLRILRHQYQAQSFPQIQGVVLSSKAVSYYGRRQVHYYLSINYSYEVAGQEYKSWRYRYDSHPDNQADVDVLVAAHPRDSAITVYDDPQNPADAVLSPGVDDQDVSNVFLALIPPLVLSWALLRASWQIDWPWSRWLVAGGVKLVAENRVIRVRLPQYRPLGYSLLTAAGLALLAGGMMAVGLPLASPLLLGGWLLLGILSGSGAVYGWLFRKAHSGTQDLVIDEVARTIRLPLTYERREQPAIPFSKIKVVALTRVKQWSRTSDFYTDVVGLKMTDGSHERLTEMSESGAHGLAAWLKEKFSLAA